MRPIMLSPGAGREPEAAVDRPVAAGEAILPDAYARAMSFAAWRGVQRRAA